MDMYKLKSIRYLFLLSYGLFILLSCTSSPAVKQPAGGKPDGFTLNRKEVLSGKATMLIPEGFKLMNEEMLDSKYPKTGHQPTEVYTNSEGTINLALNYTQNQAQEKDLPEIKSTMEGQFKQPSIEFIQSRMQTIGGHEFVTLEFITPAVDSRIFNLLYITTIEGSLAMFSFNCIEDHRKEWEATGKKIMNSIEFKK